MCHPLPDALFASSPRNRLHSPSVTETRHYNGLGQRVKRTVTQNGQSVSTHYVYDEAGQLLGEYSGDGTLINEIVYLNDLPVLLLTPDSVHAIHADHLNTPRAIVNSAGTVLWKWDSAPYGDTPAHEDPDGNGVALKFNLRFPGQLYDQETGLHYNYFRDYDPVTGRYLESDPIGLEGGVNTYGYGWENPLGFADPMGLSPVIAPIPAYTPMPRAQATPTLPGTRGTAFARTPSLRIPSWVRPPSPWWFLMPTAVGEGSELPLVLSEPEQLCDEDGLCYQRWGQEDARCWQWKGLGVRAVSACQTRAATRRDLCIRNGGRPHPDEPPEYNPFVDYPR